MREYPLPTIPLVTVVSAAAIDIKILWFWEYFILSFDCKGISDFTVYLCVDI